METRIIKISTSDLDESGIRLAAKILRNGGLVAFPTETVYGLGADALNPRAVRKIFEVKGRPKDDPLIVHIADKKDIHKLARDIPDCAEEIMGKFWPGPLTLIFKKRRIVPKITAGGLNTVAVRMPDNPIALALIKSAKKPIAAPSANLFGRPSPTSAKHVLDDLGGKIDAIIDGGKTKIGVESTVLDLTAKPPVILRPGGITLEELREVLGEVRVYHPGEKNDEKPLSPGMKYRHYAPRADVLLILGDYRRRVEKIRELAENYRKTGKKVGIMAIRKNRRYEADSIKFAGSDAKTIAKNLFRVLREFDDEKVDVIIAEGIEDRGLGLAIMNRLKKAAYRVVRI
ncbi:MAG: L-threonylcarbamoyladenylate synthase [Candidatus Micrarchaeia archaeon]